MDPSWKVLGASWKLLGASWRLVGPSWKLLEGSWRLLKAFWGLLKSSWRPRWVKIALESENIENTRKNNVFGTPAGGVLDVLEALGGRLGGS